MAEVEPVVWWSFVIGGLIGGLARSLIKIRVEMPYAYRDSFSQGLVIVPGVIGEALLGVIAGLVFGGGGATAFGLPMQTGVGNASFWGPLTLSIPVGIVAAEFLSVKASQVLSDVERKVMDAAEQTVEL